jgi:hypothetical protein
VPTIQRRTYGKFGIALKGLEELSRQIARDGEVWQRVQQAAVKGMIKNTEDLLGRSMRDAPVDEGTLRASGSAAVYANGRAVARRGFREVSPSFGLSREELTELEGRYGRRPADAEAPPDLAMQERRAVHEGGLGDAVIGEVGFNTPYALAQHERLDFNHPKGGKAKYLEDNLTEQADRYQGNLKDHLREALA